MDIIWSYKDTAEFVVVAEGIYARSPVIVRAGDVSGYDVELQVEAEPMSSDRTGRLVAAQVTVRQRDDGPPVTSEGLRGVPVARLTTHTAHSWVWAMTDEGAPAPPPRLGEDEVASMREAGPVTSTLRAVAFTYRLALLVGDPPTRVVEETFGLPRSTAGRWVALARQRGHLPAAEAAGKAGA